MNSERPPRILAVDDDPDVRRALQRTLDSKYEAITAGSGEEALDLLEDPDARPDLVLLDVRMPGIDGFEVCARMQESEETAWIPVIIVTVLEGEEDRQRAFSVGAVDYIRKPFEQEELLAKVAEHVDTRRRWSALREEPTARQQTWLLPSTFTAFKRYLLEHCGATGSQASEAGDVGPSDLHALARILRIPKERLTRYLARFLDLPYQERVNPDQLALGELPRTFCATNEVVVLEDGTVVVANPFDWDLMDVLERTLWRSTSPILALTAPERIRQLLEEEDEMQVVHDRAGTGGRMSLDTHEEDVDEGSAAETQAVANEILRGAIADRASDVHIEPKERGTLVRYRIDGEMHDIRTLAQTMGNRLVSRLKALAGMDIAERRKPQDGALPVRLADRQFKLRLATSATAHGETLVVRILEPDRSAVALEELGFSTSQASELRGLTDRSQGLILVVGPTGSGKSTTIFSLLSTVDGRARSIMSVEDPVEYRIPYANQQKVNERAGVTFEALLRSAMRQDPDILFLGEVRDPFSAHAVMDFASSGHLTISTLHSSNSTTAVFRLERLGVERGAMADAVSGVVAQKLLRTLCDECKEVGAITGEEEELLSRFTDDPPARVARPVGCPVCRETGYVGRELVGELLLFDDEVARLVREGRSIAEIRSFCAERRDYLVGRHALDKIRDLRFPVRDVYEQVLVEDTASSRDVAADPEGGGNGEARAPVPVETGDPAEEAAPTDEADAQASPPAPEPDDGKESAAEGPAVGAGSGLPPSLRAPWSSPTVLLVDDDPDLLILVERHLSNAGYRVVSAADGVEALMRLGSTEVDAVLSDVNMPNLDGVKLMEMIGQKDLDVPAIFLTATEDEAMEAHLLGMGAADYIRKPVRKEVLLMRLRNAVRGRGFGQQADS